MDFRNLREANLNRQAEWPGNEEIDVLFRMIEVCGEVGELAEAVKKNIRAQRGIKGSTADMSDIEDEMGDVIIALDLLAEDMGVDLRTAVSRKFNKTSVKYGLSTRL